MKISDTVRKNIVKLRKAKGLTQEKLAYESELSKGFLSEVESGLKNVTIQTLEKLAETLDVDVADFFKTQNGETT